MKTHVRDDDWEKVRQQPQSVLAEFTALPGHEAYVLDLILSYGAHVRAQRSTLLFEVHRTADEPSRFVVFERYRDGAAFDEHLRDPVGLRFNADLAEHVSGGASTVTLLDEAAAAPTGSIRHVEPNPPGTSTLR